MARYDHLPIYKKAFELAKYFDKIVLNFSRYNKYTYGTDLRNLYSLRVGFSCRAPIYRSISYLIGNKEIPVLQALSINWRIAFAGMTTVLKF